MKITVIGGSGYLGSHIADRLSSLGHEVIIYDKKKSKWIKKNQKFIQGDILNLKLLEKAIKNSKIIYHFAALSDIDEALLKPKATVLTNILGTVNILELATKYKIKRFVYASSIYAISSDGSFYRCSKRASEDYIEEYRKLHSLNFTILRFGSLYGLRCDETNGVYKIVSDAVKKKKLVYMGNKNAKRKYIHVIDAAKASVSILSKKFENKYVNLMGTKSYKVKKLLAIVSKLLNMKNKASYSNIKFTGHYIKRPKIFKIMKGINYKFSSSVKIQKGLEEIISSVKFSKKNS